MPEQINFTIYPAASKIEALSKFGNIAVAMSIAHATHLRDALYEKDSTKKAQALIDARKNLEAQMELAQIELFIHNMPEGSP